jgi:hypothetical protein
MTMDRLEEARRRLEQAKQDVAAAEKAEREAMAKNAGAPARILELCGALAGVRDAHTAELVAPVRPIIGRLASSIKNRCRGQCGEYDCKHDAAAERIAGVR